MTIASANTAQTLPSTSPLPATRQANTAMATHKRIMNIFWSAVAVFVFVAWMFPVYWMVNTSLQPSKNVIRSTPSFYPKEFSVNAYERVLHDAVAGTGDGEVLFVPALKNSLTVTAITLVVALVVGFVAALALTRFRFRSRKSFIVGILVIQMIPTEAMLVSQYKTLDAWHGLNNLFFLSLFYAAAVIPFTIWTLRGFVNGIPVELEEAAMVDGCSRGRAFWKVTFPLLAPGLVATGVFAMIQAWNEFVFALVAMARPDGFTLPVLLRYYQQATRATDWSGIMAVSVLMSIPVIVFFLFVQNRMTGGLVSGAVKG